MASSNQKDGDEPDEGVNGGASASGWSSWLQMAKNKSLSAFDLIKKDLAEFTQVVTKDTSKLVSGSTGLLKDVLAKSASDEPANPGSRGIQQIISSLTKSYAPYDDADAQLLKVNHGAFETFDRYKARLHGIQTNPATFCTDPDDMTDFTRWLDAFDVDSMKSTIAELLVESAPVRALYTKLVPSAMSHHLFWQRYFYRVRLLDIDEARKAELKQRADKLQSEQQLAWPDEKDDWDREDEYGSSPSRQALGCDTAKVESRLADSGRSQTASPSQAACPAAAAATAAATGHPLIAKSANEDRVATDTDNHEPAALNDSEPFVATPSPPAPAVAPPPPPSSPAVATACATVKRVSVEQASASSSLGAVTSASQCELTTIDAAALLSVDRPVPQTSLNESRAPPEEGGCSQGPVLPGHSTANSTQQMSAELQGPAAATTTVRSLETDSVAPVATVAAACCDRLPAPASPSGVDAALTVSCGASSAVSHVESTGKGSPAEMMDVLPDANVDSDWEKEFDVGDDELVSAVVSTAAGKTSTDGDLDWETWE